MLILPILTPRQVDVLKGVMRGLSNLEIAIELEVTEGNIKWHMGALFRAYCVKTRSRLMVKVAEIDVEALL